MKTPMQEMIHWVDTELKLEGYEHGIILAKINELVEKEKEIEAKKFKYQNDVDEMVKTILEWRPI